VTNPTSDKPLLYGRRRRLWIGATVLAAASVAVIFAESIAARAGIESWIVGLGGIVVFALVLFSMARGLTCPGCGVNLFWYGFAHARNANWLDWMFKQSVCPKCGYSEAGSQNRS